MAALAPVTVIECGLSIKTCAIKAYPLIGFRQATGPTSIILSPASRLVRKTGVTTACRTAHTGGIP